jgi:hypothetical protein
VGVAKSTGGNTMRVRARLDSRRRFVDARRVSPWAQI